MGRKVIITGATGLIGRQTCLAAATAGMEVIAVSRSGESVAGSRGVAADLLDTQAVRQLPLDDDCDLLHLAWLHAPDRRWSSPQNLDWAAATLQLVREFGHRGGRRILAVGSCAEYDWSQPVLQETTPLKSTSVYSAAKVATWMALQEEAASLRLSLAWARVFFCYGPGEPEGRLLGDLIRGLRAGQPVNCTDGRQRRDFLHTADIGRALVAVLQSDCEGAINVASGIGTEVRQLIMEAARQLGRTELVQLGAVRRPPDDPDVLVADVSRLRDEIGFRPDFDITGGLKDVLAEPEVESFQN